MEQEAETTEKKKGLGGKRKKAATQYNTVRLLYSLFTTFTSLLIFLAGNGLVYVLYM